MYMHEKTSSSKGSLLRDQSMMVDCDQRSEYSESISLHAEQVGPTLALSLNAILHPPTATVHTDTASSSTQDGRKEEKEGPGEEERTERRDETGLFHLEKKGCAWRQEEEEEEERCR